MPRSSAPLPGDGLEAVAVALCGRRRSRTRHALTVRSVVPIPYDECKVRTPDRITWSTQRLIPLLEEAAQRDLAILKIHSHPGGYPQFSSVDDEADADLFNSVFGWTDSKFPHASAVMLPDGTMFGRAAMRDGSFQPLDSILVPGDDMQFWIPEARRARRRVRAAPRAALRRGHDEPPPADGGGRDRLLGDRQPADRTARAARLRPARAGRSRLRRGAESQSHRERLARARLPQTSEGRSDGPRDRRDGLRRRKSRSSRPTSRRRPPSRPSPSATWCSAAWTASKAGIFSIGSRPIYVLPYFDVGVRLDADGKGGIDEACGAVHYLRPDGSTLLDRNVYTLAQLKAAGLRRTDPKAYRDQLRAGYIHGVEEDRPAVISINMQMASIAVNEFLARLHPYRHDDNAESAIVRVSFIQGAEYREREPAASGMFSAPYRQGRCEPAPLDA